jgi:hypothetical protein
LLLQEGGMFDNGRWLLTNRPPVVVLADKKKAQMDEAVHEMLRWAVAALQDAPCMLRHVCCVHNRCTHAQQTLLTHRSLVCRMVA